MSRFVPACLLSILVIIAMAVTPAAQTRDQGGPEERRVALVIGNGDYDQGRLRNPVNDARAIAQALQDAGFEVIAKENADRLAMYEAINAFGDRLKETKGVGLFYFSGHGLQVQGKNFMVPLRARITSERLVETEAIDVNRVLGEMDTAQARVNIVILDACRDNPYARSFRSAATGLAHIDAPRGTLIGYATAPGKLAEDGTGQNSPYTSALVRHIAAAGLPIETVFKRVRIDVLQRTRNRQEPWEASSLTEDFFFFPAGTVAAVRPPEPTPPTIREEIRQEFGSLAVSARIEGIEVWQGDRRLGETKADRTLVIEKLAVGTYRLKARKAGHKDWEREVHVTANQRAEVAIDIEPLQITGSDDRADMVLVPAGEFLMGSTQAEFDREVVDCVKGGLAESRCKEWFDRELGQHAVTLDAFYIDKFEVTNALFERFARATSHRTTAEAFGKSSVYQQNPEGKWLYVYTDGASWRAPNGDGRPAPTDHPVVHVSWADAVDYCRWAGKRLPTEAEWEKGARGAPTRGFLGARSVRRFPWGDEWDRSKANSVVTGLGIKPVGTYPTGGSPYGAHDMAGNVFEWVADWYDVDYYRRSPGRNPRGPESGIFRVIRGGSWGSSTMFLRVTYRSFSQVFSNVIGFRCAKDAPK